MPTPLPAPAPLFRTSEKRIIAIAVVFLTTTLLATVAMATPPTSADETLSHAYVSDLQKRGFNPQPEPPAAVVTTASLRAYNPQPMTRSQTPAK